MRISAWNLLWIVPAWFGVCFLATYIWFVVKKIRHPIRRADKDGDT